MNIEFKQVVECQGSWDSKMYSVILVNNLEDKEVLYNLLIEQDDYWEGYERLIKVKPANINNMDDIYRMTEYCGRTDIYDVSALKEQVDFFIYQRNNEY